MRTVTVFVLQRSSLMERSVYHVPPDVLSVEMLVQILVPSAPRVAISKLVTISV